MRINARALAVLVFSLALLVPSAVWAAPKPVYTMTLDGAIDPATASYVIRGINEAESAHAQALIIQMDTPGGLDDSMRQIVQAEFASTVPVVVYVSPDGARAGSAGVLITMAANVAAMAPVTNIGSAHPVAIRPGGEVAQPDKTMQTKVENDAAQYARAIATRRERNADWAEQAVRKSVNLTAENAKKQKVIDIVSPDLKSLLRDLNGRRVAVRGGTVTLNTAGAPVNGLPMDARESFLHLLANPNVAAILLMFTIYGIIFELSNPGSIVPGVVGGISLILLLYSFSVLPLNLAGLALVLFAVLLFIADVKVPSHGVLTTGGVLSLALGLFLLFNTGSPAFRISLQLLGALVVVTSGFFILLIQTGLRALKNPVVTGREALCGLVLEARTDIHPTGKVFALGTWWTAESDEPITKGDRIEVTGLDGLRLKVRKALPKTN